MLALIFFIGLGLLAISASLWAVAFISSAFGNHQVSMAFDRAARAFFSNGLLCVIFLAVIGAAEWLKELMR